MTGLGGVVAEMMMRAAAEIVRGRDVDATQLCELLRQEAPIVLASILEQGKELLDTNLSGWTSELVQAECIAAARRAVEAL